MASIRFNLKPIAGNRMQIRAVFQDGSKQTFKYTGYSIPSSKIKSEYKYWDKQKQLTKVLDNSGVINSLIEKWKSDFTLYKDECKRLQKKVNVDQFIKSLAGEEIIKDVPTLLSVFSMFLASIKVTHKSTTYNGYNVIKGKLEKFQKEKKKEILVSNVDRSFYKDFSLFLMQSEGNTNATILRREGKIATVLSYAIEYFKIKNVHEDYQKVYKLKTAPSSKFPLYPEELATLKAYKSKNEYHTMVLDSFLLACETGLRHSDIIQLQPAHIHSHVTPNGIIKFIKLANIKTDNSNDMPLSEFACKIVDKYAENNSGNLFRFQHSQAAGKVLKKIFKLTEVNLDRPCEMIKIQGTKSERKTVPLYDIISFHMARNTYITRLLSANVPAVFVKNNAGHRDLSTTMSYFRNEDINRWQETLKVLNQ